MLSYLSFPRLRRSSILETHAASRRVYRHEIRFADLNVIELYRGDEGGTVGGVYRVGKAEASGIEADAFGILIGENDPAGSGIEL